MKRHTIRLYNLIFPIWIFWMVPSLLWLLLLPANFLWDSLVLLAAAGWLRLQGKKELWKRSIVKVWLIGFAADFAGAALSLALMLLLNTFLDSHIFDPYHFPGATLHAIPGVCLAGWLIWRLNRRYSFGKADISEAMAGRLSLLLAVFTAPYLMMLPMYH